VIDKWAVKCKFCYRKSREQEKREKNEGKREHKIKLVKEKTVEEEKGKTKRRKTIKCEEKAGGNKVAAISNPIIALDRPQGSRRLRLPRFKTIGT
jgi:hypothetical protein